MKAYYNEYDKYPAQWLRNLIDAGEIAPGVVDERSIADVQTTDLAGYDRCHFFAGIAGWDYALRLAGWPSEWPVWTGSCPCQPFSAAGKQKGTKDERHLWPAWFRLIKECRPPVIFGEQVASSGVIGKQEKGEGQAIWNPLSQEAPGERLNSPCEIESKQERYEIQSEPVYCRDSISDRLGEMRSDRTFLQPGLWQNLGQPINRQDKSEGRLHLREHQDCLSWSEQCNGRLGGKCINSTGNGDNDKKTAEIKRIISGIGKSITEEFEWPWLSIVQADLEGIGYTFGACIIPACSVGAPHIRQRLWFVAVSPGKGLEGYGTRRLHGKLSEERKNNILPIGQPSPTGELADSGGKGLEIRGRQCQDTGASEETHTTIKLHRPWDNPLWLLCRDGKARPTEPGICPLSHGVPARVGKLRAYGNAIVPQVAAVFIQTVMEWVKEAKGDSDK